MLELKGLTALEGKHFPVAAKRAAAGPKRPRG